MLLICLRRPSRHVRRRKLSTGRQHSAEARPALELIGHEDIAQYALDCSRVEPIVASGGQDNLVLMWSLADAGQSSCTSNADGHDLTKPVNVCCACT